MHACLLVEDVLRLVFEYVEAYEFHPGRCTYVREPRSLRSLAALARTCGAFREPALDVLWRDIPSLYILARYTMPMDMIVFSKNRLHWRRSPTSDEWDHFDGYMGRVRRVGRPLAHQRDHELDVDSVCSRIVRRLEATGVPLPLAGIVEFRCREETRAEDKIYMDLLMGDSLRAVQLPVSEVLPGEASLPHWGQWICAPPRSLSQLVIPTSYRALSSTEKNTMLAGFSSLPSLHELSIPGDMLTRARDGSLYFTEHLTLERLTVQSWHAPLPKAKPSTPRFAYLRALTISVDGTFVNWPSQFVQHYVSPSTLAAFTIVFTDRAHGHARPMLNRLLSFLSPSTLASVAVFLPSSAGGSTLSTTANYPHGAPLALDDLSGLLRFRNLRELRVEYPGHAVPVDNRSLRVLAEGAPELELLSLCAPEMRGTFELQRQWRPTLDILEVLAGCCPRLRVVRIPICAEFVGARVDAERGQTEEEEVRRGRTVSGVRQLGLWVAPWLEDSDRGARGEGRLNEEGKEPSPSEVADFLWTLFPMVERLRFVGPSENPYVLDAEDDMWGWKEVLEDMAVNLDEVRRKRVSWRIE